MDLNEVAIFVKVVQTGSFTQAARALGMPNSTVSAKVSSLEKRLGVTLIQRTTRKLTITPAGREYFERGLRGLEEIRAAEDEVVAAQGEPRGLLRVTAPVELGEIVLPRIVSTYMRKYSKVQVEVMLTDRRVELLAESVDLAIRAGRLKDSTLIAKKLGSVYFAPFASPKYLRSRGEPEHPRELSRHKCLHFTPLGFESWRLLGPKGALEVRVSGGAIVNDLNMLKALALAGDGIALLPTYLCYQEVKGGKLTRILPEWRSDMNPVHFVYPAHKFVSPKLSAFIEMATPELRGLLAPSEVN